MYLCLFENFNNIFILANPLWLLRKGNGKKNTFNGRQNKLFKRDRLQGQMIAIGEILFQKRTHKILLLRCLCGKYMNLNLPALSRVTYFKIIKAWSFRRLYLRLRSSKLWNCSLQSTPTIYKEYCLESMLYAIRKSYYRNRFVDCT